MNPSPDWVDRAASLAIALPTGAILAAARWVTPSPLGHSTHLQLGLGRCTFLSLTGYPCPMCGMTTTFAYMAHLDPLHAIVTQPFGVLLFLGTAGLFGIAVAELLQPRGRWRRLLGALAAYEAYLSIGFLVLMGLGWVYKIAVMRPDLFQGQTSANVHADEQSSLDAPTTAHYMARVVGSHPGGAARGGLSAESLDTINGSG